jgi:hypothetical protein
LAKAIADSHPERPTDIDAAAYVACRKFLSYFRNIYTLNYDLLLYWAAMQSELDGPPVNSDDGFRTPDRGTQEYVTWDIEKTDSQNLFYLHGALHIFDAGAETKKFTWVHTGIALIYQIRDAFGQNMFPMVVAEGTGEQKMTKIKHSDYLSRAYRSFASIGGALFMHGLSLGGSDEHILKLISGGKSRVSQVFVSIFGDENSAENRRTVEGANRIADERKMKDRTTLHVSFYDAATARVWG